FSSRRRHTRSKRDWSSDVCSSDLNSTRGRPYFTLYATIGPHKAGDSMNNTPVVYVVDDDKAMLESTVWLLESVGLEARPFTGGQAFLDALEPNLNACVLLDVRMPVIGGLNVQERLLELGVNYPVIF